MVLSNKKLKQKLRAERLAESLTSSPSVISLPSNSTNPEAQQSAKQLIDLKASKSWLNKRDKRRPSLPLKRLKAANSINGENIDARDAGRETEREDNGIGGNGVVKKEKKRKRERKDKEGEVGTPVDGNEENGDVGKQNKKKKRKDTQGVGQNDDKDCELGLARSNGVKVETGNSMKEKKKKKKKHKKKKKKVKEEEQMKGPAFECVPSGDVAEEVDHCKSEQNVEAANKVYVGGIPYYSTEDDIRSYFDHCGSITDIDCMKFPESGKFRGIAIIVFKTEEAAKRALALDGADMGGLFLKIQPYRTKHVAKTADFRPPVLEGYNRIYVGNLSWEIEEEDLRELFSECCISAIRFGEDKETGEFKGYAHVDFSDGASLTAALKLDQTVLYGRPVRISCAVPKKGAEMHVVSASAHTVSAPVVADTAAAAASAGGGGVGGNGVSSGKLRRRTCYECGERGHISSDCPKKQAADKTNPSSQRE